MSGFNSLYFYIFKQCENADKAAVLKEQLQGWRHLRQDLERARLLIELVRKREKLKRDYVSIDNLTL